MKKSVIGIGIAFMDIVITSDYSEKNHSNFSKINYEIGGSILNIVSNCDNSALIYKKGNDAFSNIVSDFLNSKLIKQYPINVDYPMPIFTIINQKERYTSLTNLFEINHDTVIDYNICNQYTYGITNSENAMFINQLINNTTTKWIINSYLPLNVEYNKIEGVIMNREEAKKINNDPNIVLEILKEKGVNWAIITLDKDGCIYLENDEIKQYKATKNNLQSKIRTGDIFTATIINELINKQSLTTCIKIASNKVESFLSNN